MPAPYFLQYLRCLRLATHCARGACALFFTVTAMPAPHYSLRPGCLHLIFYSTCGACASLLTVPGVPAPYFLQYLRCLRLSLPLPGSRAGGQEARRCVTTATAHHHHHHHHAIATAHNPSQFARWPGEAPIVVTPSEGIVPLLQAELCCGTQSCTSPKSFLCESFTKFSPPELPHGLYSL